MRAGTCAAYCRLVPARSGGCGAAHEPTRYPNRRLKLSPKAPPVRRAFKLNFRAFSAYHGRQQNTCAGVRTVSESSPPTHQYLLSNDSPLLTLRHLGEVLHSTPNSVRMSLAGCQEPLGFTSSAGWRRLGRCVCFDAARAAKASDQANVGKSSELTPRSFNADDAGDLLGGDWSESLR
jgi:hypothetical protein